jgi:hypothetical protein
MENYEKEPSDALGRFASGEIDAEAYLEETEDDVVEVLIDEAAATAERACERERVDKLLRQDDSQS